MGKKEAISIKEVAVHKEVEWRGPAQLSPPLEKV